MNNVMNSIQTVTLNSAMSQKLGWVYSAHTQNLGRAHTGQVVGAVTCTADWSRACRSYSQRRSRAQHAQVTCIGRGRKSRPPFCLIKTAQIATTKIGVATPISIGQPEPCSDIKLVSRHHSGQSSSRPPNGVATPFLLPIPKSGRNTKTRPRHSWRLPYVATSVSCRDLVSTHSGISRSRHQNSRLRPPSLPPMSRPQK